MSLNTPQVSMQTYHETSSTPSSNGECFVPLFIGVTKQQPTSTILQKVTSLESYENLFGGGLTETITVELQSSGSVQCITENPALKQTMYYAVELFFNNGGEICYVLSMGTSEGFQLTADDFQEAFKKLSGLEQTFLVSLPDLSYFLPFSLCETVYHSLLTAINTFDCFVLLDLNTPKESLGTQYYQINSPYGASYAPYLNTTLALIKNETSLTQQLLCFKNSCYYAAITAMFEVYYLSSNSNVLEVSIALNLNKVYGCEAIEFDIVEDLTSCCLVIWYPEGSTTQDLLSAWNGNPLRNDLGFRLCLIGESQELKPLHHVLKSTSLDLEIIKSFYYECYNNLLATLYGLNINSFPPSPALLGLYMKLARERGVWQTPANVPLQSVLGPIYEITNAMQDTLNRSINPVRTFSGEGTVAWGGWSLDTENPRGYIGIQRLLMSVKSDLKSMLTPYVFEANNTITWLKVRSIVEHYLDALWQQGGLAGTTPKEAYQVEVGLGSTMNESHILNGEMVITLGLAVMKPTEFIQLTLTQIMQSH